MAGKALVVDDNPDNLYLLESLLKGSGLEVVSAGNGREALDAARAAPPDIIITDILMPIMDGYALCRECKADESLRRIPFVFYTATYTSARDEEFALSLGADRFVLKPQEPNALRDLILDVLERKDGANRLETASSPGGETEFFRRHNQALVGKLETKMTEIEAANRKLKIIEETYRLSFENVADVILTIGADLLISSLSPSVNRILGYKPDDFVGRPVSDLKGILSPESFAQVEADVVSVLNGEALSGRIYRFIARDGTMKYGEVNAAPLKRDGKVIGLISVARDVTDRKRAEEKAVESGMQFEAQYQGIPMPTYTWQRMSGVFTLVAFNRAALLASEGEAVRFLWKTAEEMYPDRPEIIAGLHRCFDEKTVIRKEMRSRHFIPGKLVIATCAYVPPDLVMVHLEDITGRRKTEIAFQEAQDLLNEVGRIAKIGGWKMDLRTGLATWTQGTYDIVGIAAGEPVPGPNEHVDYYLPEDRPLVAEAMRALIEDDKPLDFEARLRTIRGEVKWCRALGRASRKGGKAVEVYGTFQDVTERKEAEERVHRILESLQKAARVTIQVMASAVEARDPYTSGHQVRTANLARAIAAEMGLPQDRIEAIWMAASIHDIGKLHIPAEILSRPAKLTDIELALIREHSRIGFEILKNVESPWPLAEIVHQHHERMDGSGYPGNLKAEAILVEARIIGVADVVEAMASHRPYRPSLGIEAAVKEIEDHRGTLYDVEAAEACLRLFHEKGYRLPSVGE